MTTMLHTTRNMEALHSSRITHQLWPELDGGCLCVKERLSFPFSSFVRVVPGEGEN